MGRNIKYQLLTCINTNFQPGTPKHSLKVSNQMNNTRIFSYADRKALVNICSQFAMFMKQENGDIKYVKNIKAEHVQAFLNHKAKTGCSKETLRTYWSYMHKMGNLINATYHADVDFKCCFVPAPLSPAKIRDKQMADNDFNSLLNSYSDSSRMRDVLKIAYSCGLRTEEIAHLRIKDIDTERMQLYVHCGKGGKDRYVPIGNEYKGFYEDLKMRYDKDEKIVKITTNAIYKSLNRHEKALGIKEHYKHTAIHCIRKNFAQRQYNAFRDKGYSAQESLSRVSVILGHGYARPEIDNCIQQYVLSIW